MPQADTRGILDRLDVGFVLFAAFTAACFLYDFDVELSPDLPPGALPPVVGVGLPRTGTCSLSEALRQLGWSCQHCPLNLDRKVSLYRKKRNAVCDVTMLKIRPRRVVEIFPGAKLIYTKRSTPAWIRSMQELRSTLRRFTPFTSEVLTNFEEVFGKSEEDMRRAKEEYEKELDDVRREGVEVHEFDITCHDSDGARWADLCKFLMREVPAASVPFPRESHVEYHIKQAWTLFREGA